jgi:signal peptidase II
MGLKNYGFDYLILLLIAGAVVALDQLTQSWIHQHLALGEVYRPDWWFSAYARLVYEQNTGATMGILKGLGGIFSIISLMISTAILLLYPRIPRQDWLIRLALALYLGGAIGNLLDRLTYGYVTDFISIGFFPIFNLADLSITLGTLFFIIGILLRENRVKNGPHPA